MEGITYYIYILQLAHGGYYVGCTKNIENRLAVHFRSGGSVATKEIKAVCIDRIYTLVDYKIGGLYAHAFAEIFIACRYCDIFGHHLVRGAKHGKGWDDSVSPNGLKIINQVRALAKSEEGIKLMQRIRPYHFSAHSYWVGKMNINPSTFDLSIAPLP